MSTRTTRAAASADTEANAAQDAVTELTRQQLAAVSEGAAALFRASEVLQQVQQQAAQRAALMHQQTAEKLRNVGSAGELLSIQGGVWMAGLQEATQFWQELTAAGMKLQAEMMGRTTQQQGASTNVAGAAMTPMMQAWQNMFSMPLNGMGTLNRFGTAVASAATH